MLSSIVDYIPITYVKEPYKLSKLSYRFYNLYTTIYDFTS